MAQRLYVSSKKGLLVYERDSRGAWQHRDTYFVGSPVSLALASPRQ